MDPLGDPVGHPIRSAEPSTGGELMKLRKSSRGLFAVLCASAIFVAACSDDKDSGTTTTAGSDTTAPAADPILAEAQRISELAASGLVYAPSDTGIESTDIVALDSWKGPESSPEVPADVNVQIIFCAP